ncbi:DNA dC-_dU-editing enzyme APOBEC-3B-like isoform X2 [Cervus elaphus]|uniref:DNA dC->dU-editing enzyme APOBEC-3B-like isoform X2 n=1 Tax=Cervus elaphus TaxID=9860 RepID=UPI001CC31DAA|nr:DNA dC->dU-editing enzyme APOBEC-3B-like isoform X2 [Cervus elaphus]
MEPPHSRQSPGLQPAYRGYNQMPWIRNHVWRLDPDTFYFQFHNLLYANGRNCSYICYRVERRKHRSYVAFDWGVFHNQVNAGTRCHTELHFLTWFCKMKLHPDECYHITWYMSWSPCVKCAKQVANFLARYRNVKLSIFAARLYYFQDMAYRQGLLGLSQQGARVDIMSYREFKYCWKKFVDSQRRRFKPWKKLDINYQRLVAELDDILGTVGPAHPSEAELCQEGGPQRRNTMNLLRETLFKHQFGNQPRVPPPHYRRKTYLCYQLKQRDDSTLDRGCFRNKQRHAEIRFIDKINSLNLDPRQSYKIICYITWSPCPQCASELVNFIRGKDHLNLQIFASRLYFHWKKPFQKGLQQLQAAGISVAVMTHTEFEDCWEQFVDNQSRPFQPWEKLQQYSASITRRLQRILMAPT